MTRRTRADLRSACAINGFMVLGIAGVASAHAAAPPPPDYALDAAWAARPGHPGRSAERPAGTAPGTDLGVDVFFVHPTTDLSARVGNAPFDVDGETRARVDDVVLKFQASAFNGCCRIFAPRYRQASLRAITAHDADADAAKKLAYGDVERAFDAFLVRAEDRPFIVAGHSQGAIHVVRLLEARIAGTPLQRRLVAAYAIGTALPADIERVGIPVCATATATGCVVTWNSVRRGHDDRRRREDAVLWWDGRYQAIDGRPLVCVNPLSWRPDDTAPADLNVGAVYSAGRTAPIPAPVVGLTGADCERGLLGVTVPPGQRHRFGDVLTLAGIYHDFDYGLFYMNLRANAIDRVRAYVARRTR